MTTTKQSVSILLLNRSYSISVTQVVIGLDIRCRVQLKASIRSLELFLCTHTCTVKGFVNPHCHSISTELEERK